MNAEDIITEVIDIVDDEDYSDRELILKYVNEAQRGIAGQVLLPDLSDGYSTVDTVLGERFIDLPADYGRGLYYVNCNGEPVEIFKTETDMILLRENISLEAGDVTRVAVKGKRLTYQAVPSTVVQMDLGYYRKPVDMEDSDSSYADGIVGNEDFEWAIIHKAAATCFNKIEDGMDGAKVNTTTHLGLFAEKMLAVREYAEAHGVLTPVRPAAKRRWLGGA